MRVIRKASVYNRIQKRFRTPMVYDDIGCWTFYYIGNAPTLPGC